MNNWEHHKLKDVADVKLSNVDKKTKENERPIRLCNYTDVYKNSFINFDKSKNFMVASCNESEYEKFILRRGQVAITKDSETPNDIGVSAYISENFEDVVLGYHLSLITPNKDKLSGIFLHYWLNTKQAKRYFENNAGGSGQRCSLPLDIIKSIPLYLPDIQTQKSIAKVLSDLDAKIELNNKINRELEAMAKTLYDYWFVQFDFPYLPSDYRPSGQVNPNSELTQKIKAVCTYTQTGGLPLPDGKKWFLYVLLCDDDSFYIGITNDLYRRYYEHKTGQGAKWTKAHKPIKVIHHEEFDTQQEAAKREKDLKTGYGRTWLKREYDKFIKYGYPKEGGLPAHQTRLMTAGKMIFNEELKREIPEGWEVKELGNLIDIQRGISYTSSEIKGEGIPMISLNSFNLDGTYKASGIKTFSGKFSEKQLAKSGDLLIAATDVTRNADIIGKAILIPQYYKNGLVFSMDIAKVIPKKGISSPYLMMLFNSNHYHNYIKWYASGTIVLHLNMDGMKWYKAEIPPTQLLNKFDSFYLPIANRINETQRQNQQLSALRDWLLPMLMNGQVTVKEAEEQLSMAAEPQAEYKKG